MSYLRFFNKKYPSLTLEKIVEITGAKPSKNVDFSSKISDVKTLESALQNEISFFNSGQYLEQFLNSKAGFCFIEEKNIPKLPASMVGLVVQNPYFAHAQIINEFYEKTADDYSSTDNIHSSAKIGANSVVASSAHIGANVEIGDNCIIGPNSSILDGVVIGNNCLINANVTIACAIIGNNCQVFSGARIGQDGFGFVHNLGKNHKIIQIGIVEIGNDVEIGANVCIDRGAIGNTTIGDDVKIDNLCQIAHNVKIARGTVMAGGAAIAGSAKIGMFVQIGGNASINGHITIGDGCKIAGMSGVMRDLAPKSIVAGIPAIPIRKWHRMNANSLSD